MHRGTRPITGNVSDVPRGGMSNRILQFDKSPWLGEELGGKAHCLAKLFHLKERVGGEHGEVFELQLVDGFERYVAEGGNQILSERDRLAVEAIKQGQIGRGEGAHIKAVDFHGLSFNHDLDWRGEREDRVTGAIRRRAWLPLGC